MKNQIKKTDYVRPEVFVEEIEGSFICAMSTDSFDNGGEISGDWI